LGSKVKDKDQKKSSKKENLDVIKLLENLDDCKLKCCKKFKKGENKRCKRCPIFDLFKNKVKKAS
jgi:hypothetical protein